MLQIQDIRKQHTTGSLVQRALDGVSLSFRDNEFVAILGPSGSGKTTLLNIVGGLDRYDSGDLLINGVSTKKYSDRDWDTYRNHSIGFVFQSYNLISHQSVLANVELALTISGISKAERRVRAIHALERVGLGDQLHKKPNQMSGGQMQRVAIARALVNDPEILLADEPTGALDTQTGIQVMELLKEVAHDRLVIMVTHNPDLAAQYATRIVRLQDGKILSDSDPYTPEAVEKAAAKGGKKAAMSFRTALGLSFNNLMTKKGRTILTAFAGSIGIIGIALILALSSGVNQYIVDLQKSTMSSYPITISESTIELSSMITTRDNMIGQVIGAASDDSEPEPGVHSDTSTIILAQTVSNNFVENDLTAFKAYLDDPDSEIAAYIGENGVVYTYDTYFDVYYADADGNYLNTSRDLDNTSGGDQMLAMMGLSGSGSSALAAMMGLSTSSGAENFAELLPGTNGELVSSVVTDSYDLIYGTWPTAYNEVVLVLDSDNAISTKNMAQLGLMSMERYEEILEEVENGATEVEEITLDYADVVGRTFKLLTFSDYYLEAEDGTFYDVSSSLSELNELLDGGLELTIVGVIREGSDASTSISAAVAYPAALTEYIIEHTNASAVITAQQEDPELDVLTGHPFVEADDESRCSAAIDYLKSLGVSDKATMYMMVMYYTSAGSTDSEADAEGGYSDAEVQAMLGYGMTEEQISAAYEAGLSAEEAIAALLGGMGGTSTGETAAADESTMAALLDAYLDGDPDEDFLLQIYETYVGGSSYDDNMTAFGMVSADAPSSISIYCDTFDDKEAIADCITRYNETVDEDSRITYTDYVALLTSSITSMVDIVSYVLIAFVAVSLVVSCIMISIITQISVMERTKEIGILRAIGASKRNISQVFNAETFIIGISSGAIGVIVSELLTIPINAIIHALTGTDSVNAVLPLPYALVLVCISIAITVFSGLRPASSAAKKDPVIALRTE